MNLNQESLQPKREVSSLIHCLLLFLLLLYMKKLHHIIDHTHRETVFYMISVIQDYYYLP